MFPSYDGTIQQRNFYKKEVVFLVIAIYMKNVQNKFDWVENLIFPSLCSIAFHKMYV